MDSKEVAIARKPALARGSWTGNAAVVERNRRRAARLQAARPSNAATYPAPPYGPILGCCAYATFEGDGAEYACAARVWAQSVLVTGTAHPVVIVATTHMHGGLGNLSGQVRLAHYPPAPSLGKYNFAVTFGKLWAGQLPYARVVYVDADTLLLRSLDHLFLYEQVDAILPDDSGGAQSIANFTPQRVPPILKFPQNWAFPEQVQATQVLPETA